MVRQLVAIAILCLGTACQRLDRCENLEKLKSGDPVADAKAALARGDHHILMLGGYVGTTPGAETNSLQRVMVDGTGDTATEACRALRPAAEAYALQYNKVIVAGARR